MNAPGHPLTPLVFTISNALDDSGNWKAEADEHFLSRGSLLMPRDAAGWAIIGQRLPQPLSLRMTRTLKRAGRHNVGPMTVGQIVVETLQDAAATNPNIGPNLMLASIPRSSVKLKSGTLIYISEPPNSQRPSFWYIPARLNFPIQMGPTFVCSGAIVTDFRSGPL